MREVTISLKTTFRLMKELSGLPSTDERIGLVNLLSREALGDIKAEEKCLPGLTEEQQLESQTRQRIANALGMTWGSSMRVDDIVKFINDNCTKGAMQTIKELRRDQQKEEEVSKYLRDCLQQIGRALNQTNLTPASVTETALVYIKEKESSEHSDTYKVNSIRMALGNMSGHKYPDVLNRIKDIVEQDVHVGPVRSLHQFDAEYKLNKVEAFLIDPTKLYTACDTNQTHMRVWGIACQLMDIIKGDKAVCAPAQKAADSASDPVRYFEAKVSELEAKLAHANSLVQDIRNVMFDPNMGGGTQLLRVRELLK